MGLTVAIHQPNYLPGLRFFAKMLESDVLVLLDTVAFSKNNWTNRNRIRGSDGALWLTVPVRTKGHFGQRIREVEVADTSWRMAHLRTLQQAYARAPFRNELLADLSSHYAHSWERLVDGNAALLRTLAGALGIRTKLVWSSELGVEGAGSQLLLALCRKLGATAYLSGSGGRNYLDEELFATSGIEARWQDYRHPIYPQTRNGFMTDLSVVDLLANCGPDSSEILQSGMASGRGGEF
jgi:hypothetical protein